MIEASAPGKLLLAGEYAVLHGAPALAHGRRRSLAFALEACLVTALQQLLPELRPEDVRRAGAGVRAMALGPHGALLDDFHIVEADRMIHVLNAPSPAATASIAIGRTIAARAIERFGLGVKA